MQHMKMGLLGLAFLASPATLLAQEASFLETLLHHPAEARGDFDTWADDVLEQLADNLDHPAARLVPARLQSRVRALRDPDRIIAPLEKLVAAESTRGPIARELASLLRRQYQRLGRTEDRNRIYDELGYLGHWWTIGPFGKAVADDLSRPWPPEREIDLNARYEDGWQQISWRRAERPANSRWVQPNSFVFPNNGVVYELFQLESSEERDAVLELGCSRRLRVWVGGELAIDDWLARQNLPAVRSASLRLPKGWTRVLVRSNSPYWLRVTDDQGRSLLGDGVTEAADGGLRDAAPAPEGGCVREAFVTRDAKSPLEADRVPGTPPAEDAPDVRDPSRALDRMAYGLLALENGRGDLAVEACEQAVAAAPEDAWILTHAAEIWSRAGYLPASLQKNRSQQSWDAAVASDPDFLPAQEKLAEQLADDDKYGEAARKLVGLLEKYPEWLAGHRRLASIYNQREWHVELEQTLDAIAEIAPRSVWPDWFRMYHYYQYDNLSKARAHAERLWSRDRNMTAALEQLIQFATEQGDTEAARAYLVEQLELDPTSVDAHRELALFDAANGRREQAIAGLEKLVEERPWSPTPLWSLAALYEDLGERDRAAEVWQKISELEPGDIEVAAYLLSREDAKDAFWEPWDETLEDWVGRVPEEGPLVERAASIAVLDLSVTRFEVDGSTSEYVHQAFRLLSETAKDQLAQVSVGGRLVKLRTLLPDGTSLEPVSGVDGGGYVLPGLVPGAFTEFAYRSDSADHRGSKIQRGSFYFQDTSARQAFLLSRQVFLLPAGLDVEVVESHFGNDPDGVGLAKVEKTERELPDGGRVLIYETRNAARLDREPLMPSLGAYVPSVQVRQGQTWREIESRLRGNLDRLTTVTPEIERAAREATEGRETPLEKAQAIHEYVSELVAQPSGGGTAVQVLLEKGGNRTVLFKAMADAVGLETRWAWLRPAEGLIEGTDWSRPSTSMFPSRHLYMEVEGSEPLWIDLRARYAPFGKLNEGFSGGRALLVYPNGARFVKLPTLDPQQYEASTEARLTLLDEGGVDVDLDTRMRGLGGYSVKERMAQINDFQKNLVTRQFATQLFPGAKVEKADFPAIKDRSQPFTVHMELVAPKLLLESGEAWALPVILQPLQMVATLGSVKERQHPYVLRMLRAQRDRIDVALEASWSLARLPQSVALASSLGSYSLRYVQSDAGLRIERDFQMRPGTLQPDEYPAFLDFLQRVDAAEQERILFTKSS